MYKFSPSRKNGWGAAISISSGIGFIVSLSITPPLAKGGMPQILVNALLGCAAILLMLCALSTFKYLLSDYIYEVTDDEGGTLTVTEICFNRVRVVARISLAQIERVEPYRKKSIPKAAVCYFYCPDLAPSGYTLYLKESPYDDGRPQEVMVLMPDDELLRIFSLFAEVKKDEGVKRGKKTDG